MRFWIAPILFLTALTPGSTSAVLGNEKPATRMQATAYSGDAHPTSSGTVAHHGIVAADPHVLPPGSRIRVMNAGEYSGVYTVTDTGSKICGRHIDVFIPSKAEARQFGVKIVLVQLLETGRGKKDARNKDIPFTASRR
jgi:3D (Asp-Asp-Asp) domain-containing protein